MNWNKKSKKSNRQHRMVREDPEYHMRIVPMRRKERLLEIKTEEGLDWNEEVENRRYVQDPMDGSLGN